MHDEGLSTGKLVKRLLLLVVGMFAFGFLLVPIYDVMCQAFGINGKTAGSAWQGSAQSVDLQREVRVQFLASNAECKRWRFGAQDDVTVMTPIETRIVRFLFYSPADRVIVAQTRQNVAPFRDAAYFHQTVCFCFTELLLQPVESVEMPVLFIV